MSLVPTVKEYLRRVRGVVVKLELSATPSMPEVALVEFPPMKPKLRGHYSGKKKEKTLVYRGRGH
jgi:hypothetical protein